MKKKETKLKRRKRKAKKTNGEMMAKYKGGTIEEQAKRTLDTYRGRPGKAFVNNLKIYQMRVYL